MIKMDRERERDKDGVQYNYYIMVERHCDTVCYIVFLISAHLRIGHTVDSGLLLTY